MAAIFYVSSLSDVALPGGLPDTLGHSSAYFGLAIVVVRACAGGLPRRLDARTAAAAIGIAVAYGVSDEIHQAFVPGRTAELRDLTADAAGALAGTIACWAWGIIAAADTQPRGL
jgi:VanZ family protein